MSLRAPGDRCTPEREEKVVLGQGPWVVGLWVLGRTLEVPGGDSTESL